MRRSDKNRIAKTVCSYFPNLLLQQVGGGKSFGASKVTSLSGGLLQADASGFTKMSEELSRLGPKGAEELTGIFNRFFSSMLRIIFAHRGDVLKFGGDSLFVFFKGKRGARRAAAAAFRMQGEMKRFRCIPTSGGTFSLTLHVGINAGDFCALSLGDPAGKLELAILGQSINSTIRCNEAAESQETLLTKKCYAELEDQVRIAEKRGEFVKLLGSVREPGPRIEPIRTKTRGEDTERLLSRLLPYLPQGIYQRIEADPARTSLDSEHRRITILFLNLLYSDKLLADVAGKSKRGKAYSALNDRFKATMAE